MIECKTTIRKWGNSMGIILPKEVVEGEKMKEKQKIRILILKQDNTLKETFGTLKEWKKSTQEIKDELRKDLYNDW